MTTVNGYVQRIYTTIKHLIALSLSTIFEKSQYPTTGFVQVFTSNGLTMKYQGKITIFRDCNFALRLKLSQRFWALKMPLVFHISF